MQIFNVRFGLATNSSSSHSLVFLKEGIRAEDNHEEGDFGWGHFTLTSEASKLRYLAVLLRSRLSHHLPPHIARPVIADWIGDIRMDDDDYIDHQSWFFLPSSFGSNYPDEDFFKALKEYLLQDRLAILGGNDNTEFSHPLADNKFTLPLPYDSGWRENAVCRYDEQYNFWTVFWPETGSKLRFRLTNEVVQEVGHRYQRDGEHQMVVAPEKASVPELVDIKITNFCPFACDFCYQGSTMEGVHADMGYELYDTLHELKVFEVALGGGEPTLHPHFENILESFREHGIVPNFTTRNLGWLRNPAKTQNIMKNCGAFAFSAGTEKEIEELRMLVDYNGIGHERVNIHIVMGTVDRYDFVRKLKACAKCDFRITLLGFKATGFGADFEPKPHGWWLKEVKKLREEDHVHFNLAIDTVLAAEYEEALENEAIPKYMYHTKDGKFSCYIDMVEQKIGPSSYCKPEEMVPLQQEIPENEREGWRRYREWSDVITTAFASF